MYITQYQPRGQYWLPLPRAEVGDLGSGPARVALCALFMHSFFLAYVEPIRGFSSRKFSSAAPNIDGYLHFFWTLLSTHWLGSKPLLVDLVETPD
jgi:hypothetical protein